MANADGNVRNQDGTQNSANNPAAAGSTITLFANGLGATSPATAPGSIAQAVSASLLTPVYSSWETATPFSLPAPEPVAFVPGFVSAMLQVQVQVPAQSASGRDSVGLQLQVGIEGFVPPLSNVVGVYLK